MTSKIDFNILLAKADKNTNNACKLLEEKKLQNQKLQQRNNNRNDVQSKQAAIAFLNRKKEEIRSRTEKEARELLERKQKKLQELRPETSNASKNSKTATTTTKTASAATAAAPANKSLKTNDTNKIKPINKAISKPISKVPAKSSDKTKQTDHGSKAISNTNAKLSYSQILKMADTFHQGKLKPNDPLPKTTNKIPSTAAAKEPSIANIQNKSNQLNNNLKKSEKSEDKQSNILKQKINKKDEIAPKSTSIPIGYSNKKDFSDYTNKPKTVNVPKTSVSSTSNDTKSISSWDRIVSDMKKKKTIKKYDQANPQTKDYEDFDEDEYDSEMEDFIDDEDVEENALEKKEYSKCIQEIFNYNPKRYIADEDEGDIDNMETDFHSQMKEEKRSLKMGILEDLEELKKEAELEKKRLEKVKKRQNDGEKFSINKKLKSAKT